MTKDKCQKVDSKKYQTRKSPPYHANLCKGKVLKGNDNNPWKSISDSRGVYTWKSLNKTRKLPKGKQYETHDNGGRPFLVIDSGKDIKVYRQVWDKEKEKHSPVKEVFRTFYKKLFVGKDPENLPAYNGNSLLAKINNTKYIFIGHEVKEFTTEEDDEIEKFVSPVGNSDVPYPYAIGKENTYFILENKVIPNSVLDFKKDLYGQLYGHIQNKEAEKATKLMKKRIIIKRIY
jgi:hypothetical protein